MKQGRELKNTLYCESLGLAEKKGDGFEDCKLSGLVDRRQCNDELTPLAELAFGFNFTIM